MSLKLCRIGILHHFFAFFLQTFRRQYSLKSVLIKILTPYPRAFIKNSLLHLSGILAVTRDAEMWLHRTAIVKYYCNEVIVEKKPIGEARFACFSCRVFFYP